MKENLTIKYLQEYIKQKDHNPELLKDYFLKLAEEVGELSRALRKGKRANDENSIKGSIEEELWDVIYYTLAIANCYDIDLEKCIPVKEKISNDKYNNDIQFKP
jgi:NTP pyrophosphatase (non-canonical NTP hydrolase)